MSKKVLAGGEVISSGGRSHGIEEFVNSHRPQCIGKQILDMFMKEFVRDLNNCEI